MPHSARAQQILAELRASEIANMTVCTEVSDTLLKTLGSGTIRTDLTHHQVMDDFRLGAAEDGLYELRVDNGRTDLWQHGAVLLKMGEELLLLQAWIRHFTLDQWLDPNNAADRIVPGCFLVYSPASPLFMAEDRVGWIHLLDQLASFHAQSFDDFAAQCSLVFGVRLGAVDRMKYDLGLKEGRALRIVWRYRPLEPHTEPPVLQV